MNDVSYGLPEGLFWAAVCLVPVMVVVGSAWWRLGPIVALKLAPIAIPPVLFCVLVPEWAFLGPILFLPSLWILVFVYLFTDRIRPVPPFDVDPPPAQLPPKVNVEADGLIVHGFAPLFRLGTSRRNTYKILVLVNPAIPAFARVSYTPAQGSPGICVFFTPLVGGTVETAKVCYRSQPCELVQVFRRVNELVLYQNHFAGVGFVLGQGLMPLAPTADTAIVYTDAQRQIARRTFEENRLGTVFRLWRHQAFGTSTNVGTLPQQPDTPAKIDTIRRRAAQGGRGSYDVPG